MKIKQAIKDYFEDEKEDLIVFMESEITELIYRVETKIQKYGNFPENGTEKEKDIWTDRFDTIKMSKKCAKSLLQIIKNHIF